MKNKIIIGILLISIILIIGIILIKNPTSSKVENNNRKTQTQEEDNNIQTSDKEQTTEENKQDEIIGKWNTVSGVHSETGEKVENLREIFGSSVSEYGSYLELKEDGTFIDAIEPITNGSKSQTGTYEIKRNYNKQGDCYIILTYEDGTETKLQKVILDESNTSYLVLEKFINEYQVTLKK